MKNTGRKTVKGGSTSAPMVAKSAGKGAAASTKKTSTHAGSATSSAPTEEQLAVRSFEIFLARGGAPGHELDDWYQAVRELGA